MSDKDTFKREISALNEAMEELKLNSGIIVTRNQNDTVKVNAGNVNIITALAIYPRADTVP